MVTTKRIDPVSHYDIEHKSFDDKWKYTTKKLAELHDEVGLLQRIAENQNEIIGTQRREIVNLNSALRDLAGDRKVFLPPPTEN